MASHPTTVLWSPAFRVLLWSGRMAQDPITSQLALAGPWSLGCASRPKCQQHLAPIL